MIRNPRHASKSLPAGLGAFAVASLCGTVIKIYILCLSPQGSIFQAEDLILLLQNLEIILSFLIIF